MMLRASLFLLALGLPPFAVWAQSLNADYLPLDLGNRWTYEYHATEMDYLGETSWGDSASAMYAIVSKDSAADSICWRFLETLEGVEWYATFGTAGHSYTQRPFADTTSFELIEYTFGTHRVWRIDETDWAWRSVFCLVPDFSDSSHYFRFLPNVLPDTFAVTATHPMEAPYESLTVAFKRSIGIVGVAYHQFGLTGGEAWTHHKLREASLTTTPPSRDLQSPFDFTLENNFPNPFNPKTLITFSVGIRQKITLQIVDLLGRRVAMLFDDVALPGSHTLAWDASVFPSGTYFCVGRGANTTRVLKLLFLK